VLLEVLSTAAHAQCRQTSPAHCAAARAPRARRARRGASRAVRVGTYAIFGGGGAAQHALSATAPTKHCEPYSSMPLDMARAFLAATARPARRAAAAAIAPVLFVADDSMLRFRGVINRFLGGRGRDSGCFSYPARVHSLLSKFQELMPDKLLAYQDKST
jgi:hypothetical protein